MLIQKTDKCAVWFHLINSILIHSTDSTNQLIQNKYTRINQRTKFPSSVRSTQ